jgi:2,3-diketo-5-methylthio-1-phosphopentane phosphatase
MRVAFFSDFDETITGINVTDRVLERFADPLWRGIQEEWMGGKMSAREVLERQMPLISATTEELNGLIDSVDVDRFFPGFVSFCFQNGHPLHILSDGFDYWIKRILERALSGIGAGMKGDFVFACQLHMCEGRTAVSFPYFPGGCVHGCATCKPALLERLKTGADKTIVIGDGVSDFMVAESADMVIAKGKLLEFCRRRGFHCQSFDDFRDVTRIARIALAEWGCGGGTC